MPSDNSNYGIEQAIQSLAVVIASMGFTNPAGTLVPYAGASTIVPTGWLLCDGTAVSRTTYATLYAIIGTTYGVGDGSTTFNLPDVRGRTIVALKSTDTEFDTLGETGGAKTHTLTTAEVPSHLHTISGVRAGILWTGGGSRAMDPDVGGTQNTNSSGGGGAHNNLQPYITLHYIIKT